MLNSYTIGTLFGIKIRVHGMFLILPVLLMLLGGSLIWFLILCTVLLLHELGHSLTAQHFGIRVLDITFWPLGGMARMSHIPENTRIEGLIAIAGPAVNFVLAALGFGLLSGALAFGWAGPIPLLQAFIFINLLLGGFNLLPAFPMDGGRVLRAVLGRKGDWVGATEKAVHVGRIVAVLMGVVGAANGQWLVPVIAVWLWFAGGQELRAVRLRHQQNPLADLGAFMRRAFGEAASRSAGGAPFAYESPPSPPPPPREPQRPSPTRRPATGSPPSAQGGITDDDIERLERFRGPLRKYGTEGE